MRFYMLLLAAVLMSLVSASAAPLRAEKQRDLGQLPLTRSPSSQPNSRDYLVTLDRSISISSKERILSALLEAGVVVKQIYNYRVYKGILFSVESDSPSTLQSWRSSLKGFVGVQDIEEDSVVKTAAS